MNLIVDVTDDVETCRSLRRTVFIEEQGVSEADEMDDLDGEAIHVLAHVDGAPVGTARLLKRDETLKIGRICVLASHRGQDLGGALMRFSLTYGAEQGFKRAYLSSQTHAIPFYERHGFAAYGEEYDDAGIPHRDMERAL
jgi:ElaA protein